MTQKELANVLGVTPRNVTTLLDSLEELGFVSRAAHPTDRRAILVALSPKGRSTFERLQKDMSTLAERLFADAAEADLEAFHRILTIAVEELTRQLKDCTAATESIATKSALRPITVILRTPANSQ